MAYERMSAAEEFEQSVGLSPLELARVVSAIAQGTRDENRLTNVVFHLRHPERAGTSIRPGERAAAREWLAIRDRVVRPLLRPGTPRPGTPAPPARSPARPAQGSCRARRGPAVDRCLRPGTQQCPVIDNLVCVDNVDGVPFEYPKKIRRAPSSGLRVVTARQSPRVQRFVVPVHAAVSDFLARMRGFGLPVEAILTYGSLYCRCVSGTNTLSNHSWGDALDIVGVRWADPAGPGGTGRETIVHNYRDPAQRALLRRIDACLRLSFAQVIDYHRADHRDHFHCDTNRGRGPVPRGRSTLVFAQEALGVVLGRTVPVTGRLDRATQEALHAFSGLPVRAFGSDQVLARVLRDLFTRVATGR